jgi:hypothetical protein
MRRVTHRARFVCENEKCPCAVYDEEGTCVEVMEWWSPLETDRATGATDATDEHCPCCEEAGEPTGEFDD